MGHSTRWGDKEAVVIWLDKSDLEAVPVLLRTGKFPGKPLKPDVDDARQLIQADERVEAVVLAVGGAKFWRIDAGGSREEVQFRASGAVPNSGLGAGDGASLPGIPVSWDLLRFNCPRGDFIVLVALYPDGPLMCPKHNLELTLQ
jgi:hypothetical protein